MTFTYETKDKLTPLETYEWENVWWDHPEDKETPRAVYIGDSISCGIRSVFQPESKGIRLDGFGTSKAVDHQWFQKTLHLFAMQSPKPKAVLFNNGLHGWHLDDAAFADNYGDMVKFLLSKGAKLRKKQEKSYYKPIVDINVECPKPFIKTSVRGNRFIDDVDMHPFLIKDTSVNDELLEAVKSKNTALVDYLLNQGAFIQYELTADDTYWTVSKYRAARGIAEAIENDDVNMAAVLMHHGIQLEDKTYFYPLESYKTNVFRCAISRRTDLMRLLKVSDLMNDSEHPKIYAVYKENGFEKRYQMLQKIWKVEQMMEEKKDKEKEQKRLEEQQKKLLEEQTRQLAQKVKKLPYESKCNPRGEDYLLIQQLALAGGLYLAAKEEAPEVVNAWIPIFERIISKETLDKLMKLKYSFSSVRQIGQ